MLRGHRAPFDTIQGPRIKSTNGTRILQVVEVQCICSCSGPRLGQRTQPKLRNVKISIALPVSTREAPVSVNRSLQSSIFVTVTVEFKKSLVVGIAACSFVCSSAANDVMVLSPVVSSMTLSRTRYWHRSVRKSYIDFCIVPCNYRIKHITNT